MVRVRRLSARDLHVAIAKKAVARERWLLGGRVRTHRVSEAIALAERQVHALGVGRKMVAGKPTDSACIRFYVTCKLPRSLLGDRALIPTDIDGVPTDVIEAPLAYLANAQPAPACSVDRLRRQRPVCPGISAANESLLAGTLGAICRSTIQGEEQGRYLLSCRHVLQDLSHPNLATVRILQPARVDGGGDADAIGQFARAIPIDASDTAENGADAAIARLQDGVAITPEICRVGALNGTGVPAHGMVVHKHGRTSGYTVGVVDDPSLDALVPDSESPNAPVARFTNQFRVVPAAGMSLFAQSGDSGSLIVERKSQAAVGLLFACPRDNTFAYGSPIAAVMCGLRIDFQT